MSERWLFELKHTLKEADSRETHLTAQIKPTTKENLDTAWHQLALNTQLVDTSIILTKMVT